jgi:hypothetical protein
MTAPHEQTLTEVLAAYQRQREHLARTREQLTEITSTATAPRQVVTATVGRHGEVLALAFPTGAYKRLTPAELGAVIVATIQDARQQALSRAAELLAPLLPAGFSAQDLVSGTVDLTALATARRGGTDE